MISWNDRHMLIGAPKDFAIEVMVEPDHTAPSAVRGRMCVHVAEYTLGDFDNPYCGLGPAYRAFKRHTKNRDRLWDTTFDEMKPEEIRDTVHDALYRDDDRTMDQIKRRFDFLTNWGEQFDGYSSVIVSPTPDTKMILHRPHAAPDYLCRFPNLVVACCSRSGFLNASEGFVDWFERESKRLQRTERA